MPARPPAKQGEAARGTGGQASPLPLPTGRQAKKGGVIF